MSRLLLQQPERTRPSPAPAPSNSSSLPSPPQPTATPSPSPSPSPSPTLPDAGQFYSLLAYSGLGFAGALCIIIVFLCCCVGARSYLQQALRRNRRSRRRQQEAWNRGTPDPSTAGAAQHNHRGTPQRPYAVKLLVREALFVTQPGDEELAAAGASQLNKGEEGVTWLALRPSLDDPCEMPEHLQTTEDTDGAAAGESDHAVQHSDHYGPEIRGAQHPAGSAELQGQQSSGNLAGDRLVRDTEMQPGAGFGVGSGGAREVELGRVVHGSMDDECGREQSSGVLHGASSTPDGSQGRTYLPAPPVPPDIGQPEPRSNEQW